MFSKSNNSRRNAQHQTRNRAARRSPTLQAENLESRQLMAGDTFQAVDLNSTPIADQPLFGPALADDFQPLGPTADDILLADPRGLEIADQPGDLTAEPNRAGDHTGQPQQNQPQPGEFNDSADANLPPHLETLRQELGDEAFAEYLQTNHQQFGNLAGVSEDLLHQWQTHSPYLVEQFHQQEQALHAWLRRFDDSGNGTPSDNNQGDNQEGQQESEEAERQFQASLQRLDEIRRNQDDRALADWLESNGLQAGNLLGLPLSVVEQLPPEAYEGFRQTEADLEAWLREFHEQGGGNTGGEHNGGGEGNADDLLPPAYLPLKLQMGEEGFAGWLESNAEQSGNVLGIPQQEWDALPAEDRQALQQDIDQLQKWLDDFLDRGETGNPDGGEQPEPVPVFRLPGDTNGDGTVQFEDFLVVAQNFGQTVDGLFAAGDFDGNLQVDFADFLVVAQNFGESVSVCEEASDENAPEGGTVIQEGGELKIRKGGRAYVSDRTVDGDTEAVKEDVPEGTPVKSGVKSWKDVIDDIKDLPDGSIKGDLVISGHGADGGVDASGSDIDGEDLTAEQAKILKKKLGKGARIVILGCNQATKSTDEHMQRLADETGVPVVGNQGTVNNGANGNGDWVRFDPK